MHKDIDFKAITESFRALDINNTGILSIAQIKDALKDQAIAQQEIDEMFKGLDFNNDGHINYSVFLAATVDKHKALTMSNLQFAFHHFDVSNSGFITEEGLVEVFHREGKKFTRP